MKEKLEDIISRLEKAQEEQLHLWEAIVELQVENNELKFKLNVREGR